MDSDNEKKIGIVGSRNFTDYEKFCKSIFLVLQNWNINIKDITIISGGAAGADTLAEIFASKYNLAIEIYKPDWKKYGKSAGIIRNTDIVKNSTHIIAYPSREGRGTQDTIKKAQAKNIPVKILFID